MRKIAFYSIRKINQFKLSLFNRKEVSNAGFTLIELLVVFSVTIIISGISMLSFVTYSRTQALSGAKEQVAQVYKVAKFNAISSVKPTVAACSSASLVSYVVKICSEVDTCITPDKDYELDAYCGTQLTNISSYDLPGNITFNNGYTSCTEVTYVAINGTIRSITWPCTIQLDGYGQSITFSPS